MSDHNSKKESKGKLTLIGYVITLLSVIIIFGVALPIIRWRDPETGQGLPQTLAIACPLLIGAAFHGVASAIFDLIGFPVLIHHVTNNDNEDAID